MSSPAPRAVPSGVCLVVEASTAAGSMALLRRTDAGEEMRGWQLLATTAIAMGSGRHDVLTPALQPLLAHAGCSLSDIRAVACGAGPGSFTSLRIAGAFAKGLVFGLDVPLYALPSLLLVSASDETALPTGQYLVVADALRGEFYAQPCDVSPGGEANMVADVFRVHEDALNDAAHDRVIVRVNPAEDMHARASSAQWLGDWSSFGPVSVDEWEPTYGRLAEAQVKWEATHGRALGG